MRPIFRRLRRLEEHSSRRRDQGISLVDVLRERRRRRLEQSGRPLDEELDDTPTNHTNCRTLSEILRSRYTRSGKTLPNHGASDTRPLSLSEYPTIWVRSRQPSKSEAVVTEDFGCVV
jgi:hypothetical protein